jgi:hypothetical protein
MSYTASWAATKTACDFQLTTDGLKAYVDAVDAHFDVHVHYAQLIKLFSGLDFVGPDWFGATSRVTGTMKRGTGCPLRTLGIWVAWYNFVRANTAVRMTPCMAAGVTDHIWSMKGLLQAA